MVNVITPQEVRKLPEGSKVREHSVNRWGYPQYLDLVILIKAGVARREAD